MKKIAEIYRLGSTLTAGVVAMGLLLGASMAQAAVVFSTNTPNKAVGITDLNIGGTFYNVAFDEQTPAVGIYGGLPGVFDFTTVGSASAAVDAVVAELNTAGALRVGEEVIDTLNPLQETFNVGYGSTGNDALAVVDIVQAAIDVGTWANLGADILLYNGDERTYATFTVSQPPIPVPAAAWLFGTGMVGLIGITRRRKAKA